MPMVAVAAVAAIASYGASAAVAAGLAGAVAAGTISATVASVAGALVGAIAGLVVSTIGGMLFSGGNKAAATTEVAAQDRKQAVRSAIAPRNVVYGRAVVAGPIVYIGSSGPNKDYLHIVMPFACHPVDGVEMVRINEFEQPFEGNSFTGGQYGGAATYGDVEFGAAGATYQDNTPTRLHVFDGTQTVADADLVNESGGEWTANHILAGTPYVYVRLKYDQDRFPSGFQSLAVQVRGKPVWDPRNGQTYWSANPALCILDYLTAEYGLACAPDEIDLDYFVYAANLCDEQVPVLFSENTHQARYTLDGSFKLDQSPADIMDGLLSSCAGTITYVQGRYRLHVGAYDPPAVSLGPGDFAGDIEVVTRAPRKELFNAVRGTFINPAQKWTATDFPMVTVPAFEAEDGEQIVVEAQVPYTIDAARAQRLARQKLLRSREPLTIRAPLKYSALRLAVMDTVAVTMPDLGWDAKPFRIVSWQFDPVTAVVTAEMHMDEAALYAWDALDAAPPQLSGETNFADPLVVPAPSNVQLEATTTVQEDGTILPALLVTWTAAASPWVTSHEVQWLPDGAPTWLSREVAMPTCRYAIPNVEAGAQVSVRVRALAGLVRGPWSTTYAGVGGTDTTPPSVPTGLAAQGLVKAISISWILPPEYDLAAVEVWEGATGNPGSRAYVGETAGTGFLRSNVPPSTTRYYWVRARDRSRNVSGWAGPVSATSSYLLTADLEADIQRTAAYAQQVLAKAPTVVSALPAGGTEGQLVTLTTDGKLYVRRGGAWQVWIAPVPDGTGKLSDDQLAEIAAARLSRTLSADQVASIQAANVAGLLADSQIAAIDHAKIVGKLVAAQIDTIHAAQITDQLSDAQLAALSAAKLTGQIASTQISDNSISTPKLQAGAVLAGNIGAGQVTTAKLAVGSDSNFIANSTFKVTTDDWGGFCFLTSGTGSVPACVLATAASISSLYVLAGEGGAYLYPAAALASNQDFALYSRTYPIRAGQTYHGAALCQTNSGGVSANISWVNSAGQEIGTSDGGTVAVGWSNGGTQEANYGRATVVATAPVNAVAASFRIVHRNGGAANQPAMLVTKAMFGQTVPGATEVPAWAPGGLTSVNAGMVETNAILARHVAADQITSTHIASRSIVAGDIQAGTLTATEIAGSSITGDRIAGQTITGTNIAGQTITGQHVAAGAITTEKLAVGSASNFVANSCAKVTTDDWFAGCWGGSGSATLGRAADINANYSLAGEGSFYLFSNGNIGSGNGLFLATKLYPAKQGVRYHGAALVIASTGTYRCTIQFFDSSQNQISAVDGPVHAHNFNGGTFESYYERAEVLADATSSNTAYVRLVVYQLQGSGAASQPTMIVTKAMLGATTPNATQVLDWVPGGATSISAGLIETDAISARHIAAGAVTAGELAANAVTAGKIAAGAVTAGTVAANAITSGTIAANAVTAGTVAAGAIGADQIAANQVKAVHLASEQLLTSSAQIGNGVIQTANIGDLTVSNAKIANLSVGTGKIAQGAVSDTSLHVSGGGDAALYATVTLPDGANSGVVLFLRAALSNINVGAGSGGSGVEGGGG